MSIKYEYDDPTGGGDEITLSLPVWAEPPSYIPIFTDRRMLRAELVGETDG